MIKLPDIKRIKKAEPIKMPRKPVKSIPKSKQVNPVGWYDKKMSVKNKGLWLQGWQNAQKKDARDKGFKKAYLKNANKNVFSKIAMDLVAVPGDWGLNDKT